MTEDSDFMTTVCFLVFIFLVQCFKKIPNIKPNSFPREYQQCCVFISMVVAVIAGTSTEEYVNQTQTTESFPYALYCPSHQY